MIVRRHMIRASGKRVGETVIADVDQDIEVIAAHRVVDRALCLTGTETGDLCIYKVAVFFIFAKSNGFFVFVVALFAPVHQVLVDFLAKLPAACKRDQCERSDRDGVQIAFFCLHDCSSVGFFTNIIT